MFTQTHLAPNRPPPMIPTSAAAVQNTAESLAPAGTSSHPCHPLRGRQPQLCSPLLLPCSLPFFLAFSYSRQGVSEGQLRFFFSLREPRMMLRLCNVNRCGLHNYSCLSSGGACFSFTRAQHSMGCSRGGHSPGKTAAAWAAVPRTAPRESPPSQGGAALG